MKKLINRWNSPTPLFWQKMRKIGLMFASFGLNVAKTVLVHSEQEAIKATQRLGPVVVMKLSVPDLAHKSDIGGVILNIANSEDAKNAWNQLSQIYLKLSIDEKVIAKSRATSKKKAEEIASKRAYFAFQEKINTI